MLRTGKEIRFRFGSSEDKADTASRTCLPAGRDSQEWKIIYLQVLIVLKSSHPLRPVGRLSAAGCRPDTLNIKVAVPIERPKLLQTYLPHIKIQKNGIYGAFVPVDAN